MVTTYIHQELARLAQDSPAAYITIKPFARLTVQRLIQNIDLLRGKEVIAGDGSLSAALVDVQWSDLPIATLVPAKDPISPDLEVDVLVPQEFLITVDIFITGDRTSVISKVKMRVNDARVHLHAETNKLVFHGSDFSYRRYILREPNADQILAQAGIDTIEVAYVEGHIGYGVVSQAVSQSLGTKQEYELSQLFPAIDFGSAIKLAILRNGEALGIIPTGTANLSKQSRCECTEGPDYKIDRSETNIPVPPDPRPNDEIGTVKIGGPVPDNKDPLVDFGRRGEGDGVMGIYVPKMFGWEFVPKVMPAIKIKASDEGTIGYRAEASVGFENFRLSLDVNGGGLLLDIDLDISISAYCDFEVFKGVRLPIGWAIVMPANGSQASLQIGFYPSIDTSGTVKLKSTLKKCDMGSYVAVVIGIGTALKFLGVTAWIGFLIDVVLATILSTGLPHALKKSLRKELGANEWKLLDGLLAHDPKHYFHPYSPFSVDADSLLVSFGSEG